MQQFSFTRVTMDLSDAQFTPVQPFQLLTCIVSPREEHATIYDVNDQPPVPANAMGVVVGGLRFYLSFELNPYFSSPAITTSTLFTIKSALVVLPLDPLKAQTPLLSPITPNLLSQQGVQVEDPAGLATTTYERPRILWRGLDTLRFVGQSFVGLATPSYSELFDAIQVSEEKPTLHTVKSKVRLAMDQGLFLLHEVATGIVLSESQHVIMSATTFGVAAVKMLRRGQGAAQ